LYLHVTSTSKEGLEKAVAKIEELMKQELPQLVDERRFRRREQETVERDEFGRVRVPDTSEAISVTDLCSANGRKRKSRSSSSLFPVSTSVLKLSATAVRTSSTSSRRRVAVSRSKAVALVTLS
jgi:hypothetical protein